MSKTFGRTAMAIVAAATLGLMLTTGCRVDSHKNGGGEDVKIATPFGGMSVKTDQASVVDGVGLTVYPGAVVVKKDKDNGAADVNMNFGGFHLGVKAISYKTTDAPDKVIAFYRKDMARYGAVILCRGNRAIGTPDHTQDGLACDKGHGSNVHVGDDDATDELRAGSRLHQHIVAIDPDGTGTKFALIALDLPTHLDGDKDKD